MKQKIFILLLLALWGSLVLGGWFLPNQEISQSERRPLAQMPEVSGNTIFSGKFMKEFESFTLDQFPLRDSFRRVKSLAHYYVFGHKDNNHIYLSQGHAAKQEYPLNEASLTNAMNRFNYLYEKYLTDSRVYMAVIPDKGYYLAEESGHLAMDYEKLFAAVQRQMPWATHIDLTDSLQLEDYYRTDTHWRQENLLPVAQKLTDALGVTSPRQEDFTVTVLDRPFYGVYYGQAALPMDPEKMVYLDNDILRQCTVYDYESGKTMGIYDLEKGTTSRDQYDVFLSGSKSLLRIDNPAAKTEKELIIFRDSFGSSVAPLLVADYASVTLVDVRYIRMDTLERFLEFEGKDVLMLYSTLVLNQSSSIQ